MSDMDHMHPKQEALDLTEHKASQEWHEHDQEQDIVALAATYVPGSAEEKAFLKKIDRRIIVSFMRLALARR